MVRNSVAMAQWREMESKGMEIGSHSWSHPHLDRTSPKECLDQVVEMRRYLEKETGHPVISFAYPYGYKPANDALAVIMCCAPCARRATGPGG